MKLKRIYAARAEGEAPKLDHMKILHAGPRQRFSTGLVDAAVLEGWMTLGGGKIVIHAQPADVTYKIVRMPGYYCCHCAMSLDEVVRRHQLDGGLAAQAHVASAHPGAASPDPGNPVGYCRLNFYDCVKEG